ncbi:2-keto-4-pentenoate hydratase/2-oxohepta-3-ene-1,7-dioic acid hydratase in catechol pathway [Streptomyces aurantiacus]|uniref:fumarylacetoacetate hydrolase family protein n=1 Tax=Streptomyces aurantiacus TaxID=47760 RepID=UPI00278F574A|nr:fumarylacetoacetate hydrolase family protein [Streptomyces aurantiacus]MDQ0772800.1 2-keto-4-pentenoate hydratase/2-oxohepta-3-ene-1,7-dioic acid hydratase in catechol pathway [Streptomyces aurantiacus]
MKIVGFGPPRSEQPGVLLDDEQQILPLAPVLTRAGLPTLDTNTVLAFLPYLQPIIETAMKDPHHTVAVGSTRLGPPVPRPEKIIVAGGNYQSHVDEASGRKNAPSPSEPLLVLKPSNTVIGPHDTLVRPPQTQQLDYETEIAVVIGHGGHRIAQEDAYEHVAGYMIGNDVTARDMAFKDIGLSPLYAQLTRAKGIPTGAPFGPWLATKDEIPDPHDLRLRCWVNGELRQDGSSSEMIVDIPGLISDISKVMEFSPGDIIYTGTTTGCGAFQDPPSFLFAGDVVRMEITGLGVMETPVTDGYADGAGR